MKKALLIAALLFAANSIVLAQKFQFKQKNENEFWGLTYIHPDSVFVQGDTFLFRPSATNQNFDGCLCLVKTDSLFKDYIFECTMLKTPTRPVAVLKEDLKKWAVSILVGDDPFIFYWEGQ